MSDKKNPKIILHVDDDLDDHFLFRHAINKIDPSLVIREVRDGLKAVEFLTQSLVFGDIPNLIILDMNMPIMDGIETFKVIKQDPNFSAIPIVIFTTSLNDEALNYCRKENIPAFEKPSTLNQFTDCVMRILDFAN